MYLCDSLAKGQGIHAVAEKLLMLFKDQTKTYLICFTVI